MSLYWDGADAPERPVKQAKSMSAEKLREVVRAVTASSNINRFRDYLARCVVWGEVVDQSACIRCQAADRRLSSIIFLDWQSVLLCLHA